jgi:hypothetical protein
MLMFALAVAAFGAPEEIVVYGDGFARWDNTRWYVSSEILSPFAWQLQAKRNASLPTHALSIRAVLACNLDAPLGKRGYEVLCVLEDLQLSAAHADPNPGPLARAGADAVLAHLDDTLTGASLQLHVRANGAVSNVDLEGLEAGDRRSASAAEALRGVLGRLAAGFHLKAKHGLGDTWVERDPLLLRLPSLIGSSGSSELVHRFSEVDHMWVVQTVGSGVASVPIPTGAVSTSGFGPRGAQAGGVKATSGGSGVGSQDHGGFRPEEPYQHPVEMVGIPKGSEPPGEELPEFPPPTMFDPVLPATNGGPALDVDARFDLTAFGVAAYRPVDGVLVERVWVVRGVSAGGVSAPHYWHAGQFLLLEEGERPAMGESRLVAGPGRMVADLEPWPRLSVYER